MRAIHAVIFERFRIRPATYYITPGSAVANGGPEMTSSTPMRCKCRKQAITGLRCSRCFVPICPDCSRPAPVGMLCSDCARGKPSHLYQLDPRSFAAAIPVTLAAALFGGWLMASVRGLGFFAMFIGYLYG